MVTLIKILQVILALSLLILVHELGHFIWAKIFRIRVEKFYLFFDIKGKKIAHWKWGETEFGIGWLPLGGYCKIAGMVDESLDMDQLKNEPQPWEFRTHPAWQRLLVMFGGVLNNFIFAIVAYCCILGIWGEQYIANKGSHIIVNDLSYDMGFRTGDEILSFDDYVPENFGMLQADLARRNVSKASVARGADTLDIYIDQAMIGDVMNTPGMFDLAIPFVVDSVMSASPNQMLCSGDRIIQVDSLSIGYLQEAREVLSNFKGELVEALVVRDSDTLRIPVQIDTAGTIGFYTRIPNIVSRRYNFLSAIPAGIRYTGETIGGYLDDLRLLATPSTGAYKSVGSFIAIGQVMPSSWDWYQFLSIVALLSIMLAIMNLIPIPGLDGGHILFTLYEMVSGRKPSDKFLYIAQLIGLALLMGLMFLAFGNDIGRLIH